MGRAARRKGSLQFSPLCVNVEFEREAVETEVRLLADQAVSRAASFAPEMLTQP